MLPQMLPEIRCVMLVNAEGHDAAARLQHSLHARRTRRRHMEHPARLVGEPARLVDELLHQGGRVVVGEPNDLFACRLAVKLAFRHVFDELLVRRG